MTGYVLKAAGAVVTDRVRLSDDWTSSRTIVVRIASGVRPQ